MTSDAVKEAVERVSQAVADPHATVDTSDGYDAADLRIILSALASAGHGEGDRWRPIAEAPEKTDVLVSVTHNLGADEWETIQWVDFRIGDQFCQWPQMIHVPFGPTHWQPLPQPPAIQEGEG